MDQASLDVFCKNRWFRVHFVGFLPIQGMKNFEAGRQDPDTGQAYARWCNFHQTENHDRKY
jgi:hypothetical protein